MVAINNVKDNNIQYRLSGQEMQIIERAAARKEIRPSVYARRSAVKQAEMDIIDQKETFLTEKEMSSFIEALDQPAKSKPELRKLLGEESVLE